MDEQELKMDHPVPVKTETVWLEEVISEEVKAEPLSDEGLPATIKDDGVKQEWISIEDDDIFGSIEENSIKDESISIEDGDILGSGEDWSDSCVDFLSEAEASNTGGSTYHKRDSNFQQHQRLNAVDRKVNTADLIYEVQKNSAIWNSALEEYRNKIEKINAWQRVIKKFYPDFGKKPLREKNEIAAAIQKKWKGIRSCYSRELLRKKAEKSGSGASGRKPYIYFETLCFLETVTKKTTSSLEDGCSRDGSIETEDVEDVVLTQQEKNKPAYTPKKSRKRQNKDYDEFIHVLKKKICMKTTDTDEKDEDRLFLLSLVSEMHKVPPERKLKVKLDMLMIISNAQIVHQMPQPFQYHNNSSVGIPFQSVPQFSDGPSCSTVHPSGNSASQSNYDLNLLSPASISSQISTSPTPSESRQNSDVT